MTETEERLKSIAAKNKAIEDLTKEMVSCLEKSTEIAIKKSSPYHKVNMRRMFQIFGYTLRMKQIKIHLDMVMATPIFPGGGLAIVGEEIKLNKKC